MQSQPNKSENSLTCLHLVLLLVSFWTSSGIAGNRPWAEACKTMHDVNTYLLVNMEQIKPKKPAQLTPMSLHLRLRPRFGPLDHSNLKEKINKNLQFLDPSMNATLPFIHWKIPKVVNLRFLVHRRFLHSRFLAGCSSARLLRRREHFRLPKSTANAEISTAKLKNKNSAKIYRKIYKISAYCAKLRCATLPNFTPLATHLTCANPG